MVQQGWIKMFKWWVIISYDFSLESLDYEMIRVLDDDMTVFLYHLTNVGNHKISKMLNSEKIFNSENGKMKIILFKFILHSFSHNHSHFEDKVRWKQL